MICNKCGKLLPDDATKCDNCFSEVEKIDFEKFKKNFMPKKNVKELIITVILIIIIIAIGFIIYSNIKNFDFSGGIKNS